MSKYGNKILTNGRIIHFRPNNGTNFTKGDLVRFVGADFQIIQVSHDRLIVINTQDDVFYNNQNLLASSIYKNLTKNNKQISGAAFYCAKELIKEPFS